MSKFLKFIVHLVILLAILDVLALAVPPFLGINTVIIDGKEKATNMPVGSVTYAQPVSVNELQAGDSVLVQEGDSVFRYKINSIDTSNGVFQVYDPTDVEAGEKSITLKNVAPKVVITIGYVAYLIIATQSMEGMIIIGLVILFLIILFILAELWRKDKRGRDLEEPEGENQDQALEAAASYDAGEPKQSKRKLRKEMKKELKRKAKEEARLDKEQARREYEEATRQLKEEAKQNKKEAKRKRKEARRRARTGGFIEDLDPIEAKMERMSQSRENVAADEANQLLKESVAAATVEKREEPKDLSSTRDVVIPKAVLAEEARGVDAAAQEELAQQVQETLMAEDGIQEEPPKPEIRKMAIPVYTQEQLLAKAQAAGEAPEVVRDEKTGVTFLDYSSIIIEETEKLLEDQ